MGRNEAPGVLGQAGDQTLRRRFIMPLPRGPPRGLPHCVAPRRHRVFPGKHSFPLLRLQLRWPASGGRAKTLPPAGHFVYRTPPDGGGLQGPGAVLMGAFRTLCVRCYAEKFSPYPKCLQFASVFAGGHSVREQGRPGKFCGYKTGLCQTVLSGFANFPASMLVTKCTDRAERKAVHCCFGFGRTLCDWDLMQ